MRELPVAITLDIVVRAWRSPLAAIVVAIAAVAPTALAAPELRQPRGMSGCLVDPVERAVATPARCATARLNALSSAFSPQFAQFSPVGGIVYLGDTGTSLGVYRRDARSGRLRPVRGGCLSPIGDELDPPCRTVRLGPGVLDFAFGRFGMDTDGDLDAALTPDGKQLVVPNEHGLQAFNRAPKTGLLRLRSTAIACLGTTRPLACRASIDPGCEDDCFDRGRVALFLTAAAMAPGGRHIYAFASGDSAGYLIRFDRNPRTGMLRLSRQCWRHARYRRSEEEPKPVCVRASWLGDTNTDDLNLSPDGRHLYVESGSSVVALRRDARTGALRRVRGRRCTIRSRAACDNLGYDDWYFSPDGRSVYVDLDSDSDGLLVLGRNPYTGALRELPRAQGCVLRFVGCTRPPGRFLSGSDQLLALEFNAAGTRLHVVWWTQEECRREDEDGDCISRQRERYLVLTFLRAPHTGALTPLRGRANCFYGGLRTRACTALRPRFEPANLMASPDGRHLYVLGSGAIATLRSRPAI